MKSTQGGCSCLKSRAGAFRPVCAVVLALLVTLSACAHGPSNARPSTAPRQTVLLSEFSYGGDTPAYIHVLDGRDLSSITRIDAIDPSPSVRSVPGGERILAAMGNSAPQAGCCALYVLDLVASTSCRLTDPLADYVASTDGQLAYSQRGNTPIAIHDLATASLVDQIPADGNTFALYPSPDGKWLAAASRYSLHGEPEVWFIDTSSRVTVGTVPIELAASAWHGDSLYGLTESDDGWHLLSIGSPDMTVHTDHRLEDLGVPISPRVPVNLLSVGDTLVIHVAISDWMIFGSRSQIGARTPGGLFILELDSEADTKHYLPRVDLGEVAASDDGTVLYAMVSSSEAPRLLAIDAETGDISAERDLLTVGQGRWGLGAAMLSAAALDGAATRNLGPCANGEP